MNFPDLLALDPEDFHCECPLNGGECCKCGLFRCEALATEAIRHTIQWRQQFSSVDSERNLREAALLNLTHDEADISVFCAHDGHPVMEGEAIVWHPANPDVVACRAHQEAVLRF